MNVYFRDSYGEKRLLAENVPTKEVAWKHMQSFMNTHNFECYYTRMWFQDGYTWFDVGSHTEFFLVDKNLMEQYENEQEEEKAIQRRVQRKKKTFGYQPE